MAEETNSEDDSASYVSPNFSLQYINKELGASKLTSQLLLHLLDNEQKRMLCMEDRAKELETVTRVEIEQKMKDTMDSVKTYLQQIASVKSQFAITVRESLPNKSDDPHLYAKLEQIDQVQKTKEYILVGHFIKFVSTKIMGNLKAKDYAEAIRILKQLHSLNESVLCHSEASNLTSYSENVVNTWTKELHQKFSTEFEKITESIGWPHRLQSFTSAHDGIKKFQNLIRCFCRLTSDDLEKRDRKVPLDILVDYPETSEYIKVLMKPLTRRFVFHFCGKKATADISKPEWFFTHVKHWIRDLIPFLRSYVDTITLAEGKRSGIAEFIQSISELLLLKSNSVIATAKEVDDIVFSKILEESIRFESDMKSLFAELGIQESIPRIVNPLFSQPQVLSRWLAIEKRGSLEKLDILFSSTSAWNRVIMPGPTEIAELFVMMLQFMVDRVSNLHQPGHKLQFIELLVEVLDDFRARCLQVWSSKPFAVPNGGILVAETLGYVHGTLQNWKTLPFFSNLTLFWSKMRKVEKQDLEVRRNHRLFDYAEPVQNEEDAETYTKKEGPFSAAQDRYADSMEILLLSLADTGC